MTETVNKVYEGPKISSTALKNGEIVMVLNTTEGRAGHRGQRDIRAVALNDKIPYFTTAAGSIAPPWPRSARAAGRSGSVSLQAA